MCYSPKYNDAKGSDIQAVPNNSKQGPSPTPKGTLRPRARTDVREDEQPASTQLYRRLRDSLLRRG